MAFAESRALLRRPFQRATSRSSLCDLLDGLLLTEQPFGKIYSLRQFRHLPAQLLDAFDQLRLILGGSAGCRATLQSLGIGLPDRGKRDHPGEEATHGHDRDHQRKHAFHQPPLGFARSRSAKSIRSASSATSSRTCRSSFKISSRSAVSMPGLWCSPAIRLEIADTTGRSTNTNPPTTAISANTSRIHRSVFLASSRSVKSTRSLRSPISRRAC